MESLEEWYAAPVEEWSRPYMNQKMGTDEHKTCWDCEHMRVRGFATRACAKYPDRHMYSCLDLELEESNTTIADNCKDFVVRSK